MAPPCLAAAALCAYLCVHLGNWRDLRYHGDWMLRPIASNEIAWLVRLLVNISRAFNSALGLTGVPTPPGDEPPETVVQVCINSMVLTTRRACNARMRCCSTLGGMLLQGCGRGLC